jgi:thymidine phosphorylase
LICASILSKKLAEGLDGLVMDVKVGRGAFMKTEADARALAERLVAIGNGAGVRTEALLTTMDGPLGVAIGNALEVQEAVDTLAGHGPADVTALSVLLTARMLRLGGLVDADDAAHARAQAALNSGAGLERFQRMVARQGGDASPDRLPQARHGRVIAAARGGYLAALDADTLGRTAMRLGGGRERAGDPIDPSAGLLLRARPGARLSPGDPILELCFNDEDRLPAALSLAETAIHMTDEPPPSVPLVLARIG